MKHSFSNQYILGRLSPLFCQWTYSLSLEVGCIRHTCYFEIIPFTKKAKCYMEGLPIYFHHFPSLGKTGISSGRTNIDLLIGIIQYAKSHIDPYRRSLPASLGTVSISQVTCDTAWLMSHIVNFRQKPHKTTVCFTFLLFLL